MPGSWPWLKEESDMDKQHDHVGPWWGIAIALAVIIVLSYVFLMMEQHQFDVIYDRVGEMQRQMDCWPDKLLVADHDGNEYCFEIPTPAAR